MSDLPLKDRIALVTGASRGIGKAAALALANAGAHVVAVARTPGALEALDDEIRAATGQPATLVPMDIGEVDGLDQLGLAIHERFGRLDILVHAAALLGSLTPVSHIEPKHWDRLVAVNLTASFRLIRSVEPLLRASEHPRAIFLTSSRASAPKAFWGSYGATKAAMEALVRTWADELEQTKVRAVLLDPGAMRTRMRAEAMPGENPAHLPDPSEIGPLIVDLAQADMGLPTSTVVFSDWKTAGTLASA
ncbi:MAG: SDR family NAD(P)-dependent oxidoreductase [Alphaproteobacteria bacterium]|nr:SDR family NAD(P)-dependent oxidoreductase [Alphaproteobacteria bacterium]MBU1513889.1 SDR family NAD(P)-dependent oxidoreductase [Alphaproteobacteria bacterium]MBU2094466.1 SDR family NAD(P)-dependent oxidoreductase [Alphaproteobacteria bacterium]MBU2149808.1 SDR family NAD(P)-dependent oxidoreductase [Alphaproteobacteria bacterium]MBU2307279.1 SDR family NAD(P)-dependent oxidoreductase [Alphaproteobacteria bacterium]